MVVVQPQTERNQKALAHRRAQPESLKQLSLFEQWKDNLSAELATTPT